MTSRFTTLSDAVAGAGVLGDEGTKPGQLALSVYCQLEADVDDSLAAQAVKCLVHLSKEMLQADRAAGLVPAALDTASRDAGLQERSGDASGAHDQNTADAADSEAESEGPDEPDRQQLGLAGAPGLTLQGLVRRMAKMAGDR